MPRRHQRRVCSTVPANQLVQWHRSRRGLNDRRRTLVRTEPQLGLRLTSWSNPEQLRIAAGEPQWWCRIGLSSRYTTIDELRCDHPPSDWHAARFHKPGSISHHRDGPPSQSQPWGMPIAWTWGEPGWTSSSVPVVASRALPTTSAVSRPGGPTRARDRPRRSGRSRARLQIGRRQDLRPHAPRAPGQPTARRPQELGHGRAGWPASRRRRRAPVTTASTPDALLERVGEDIRFRRALEQRDELAVDAGDAGRPHAARKASATRRAARAASTDPPQTTGTSSASASAISFAGFMSTGSAAAQRSATSSSALATGSASTSGPKPSRVGPQDWHCQRGGVAGRGGEQRRVPARRRGRESRVR